MLDSQLRDPGFEPPLLPSGNFVQSTMPQFIHVYVLVNNSCTIIAAWQIDSQGSRVGVGMNMSARG